MSEVSIQKGVRREISIVKGLSRELGIVVEGTR